MLRGVALENDGKDINLRSLYRKKPCGLKTKKDVIKVLKELEGSEMIKIFQVGKSTYVKVLGYNSDYAPSGIGANFEPLWKTMGFSSFDAFRVDKTFDEVAAIESNWGQYDSTPALPGIFQEL